MKTISEWFDEYSESHQNKTNKLIHWICVPTIYFSIVGILAHFSVLLTTLLLRTCLYFLRALRHRVCRRYGCVNIGFSVANLGLTCRLWFLYWLIHFGLDWAVLRP